MRKSQSRQREERLLEAIGSLPEDMIAKAEQYQPERKNAYDRNTGWWKQQGAVWRLTAAVICVALVVFGSVRGASWLKGYLGKNGTVANKETVVEFATGSKENQGSKQIQKTKQLQLWTCIEQNVGQKETKKKSDAVQQDNRQKSLSSESRPESDETVKKATVFIRKEIKANKTIQLQEQKVKGKNGKKIPVVTVQFGRASDKKKFLLRSRAGICNMVLVYQKNKTTTIEKKEVICASGSTIALSVKQTAVVCWAEPVVSDWDKKGIEVLDIIDMKEAGGEAKTWGRVVIGRKGGKYYGLYQKESN